MIPCDNCLHDNPVSARYCHSCGAKLDRNKQNVLQAVAADRSEEAARQWITRGHTILVLGAFMLLCALVLRYIVVPPLPEVDVQRMEMGNT